MTSDLAKFFHYGLDDRGIVVRFQVAARGFSLLHSVQTGSEAHPASYQMGTEGLLPRDVKVNPDDAEFKNAWSHTSNPPFLMTWCLSKQRDNFTFYSGRFLRTGSGHSQAVSRRFPTTALRVRSQLLCGVRDGYLALEPVFSDYSRSPSNQLLNIHSTSYLDFDSIVK
jgi:hypothetical protein